MDQIITIDSNHIVTLFAPDEAALRKAASSGIRSIVNFRTSDEKGGLSLPDERRVAEAAGLNYLHHLVTVDTLDDELVDDFRRSLIDLPQPVLFHCASGKRAGAMTLMALAADRGLDGEATIDMGRQRGLDLSQEKIGQFVTDYADRKSNV